MRKLLYNAKKRSFKTVLLTLSSMLFISLMLSACGGDANTPKSNTDNGSTDNSATSTPNKKSAKDIKLGVVWIGKSSQADKTYAGFETKIKKDAADMNIEIKKELKDSAELATTIATMEKEKNAIVVLRSNGVEWLAKNSVKVPVFIGGCNRPDLLGLKDMESKSITGTSYYEPKNSQFDVFKSIVPKLDSVLLLIDGSNPSGAVDQKETEEECKKLNIKYEYKSVTSKDELLKVVGEGAGKYSAFILGTQSLIMDNTKDIVAKAVNTPCFGFSASTVTNGALAGYAPDDAILGSYLAESVIDVLINGKNIKNVPLKLDKAPKLMINESTAKKLNITIPQQISMSAKIVK